MPGITGIITKHFGAEQKAALGQMVRRMEHEVFYVSGIQVEEKIGLGIGWVTHKGTFSDCLPVWNERRDVCLFFTGEHFGEHQRALASLRATTIELLEWGACSERRSSTNFLSFGT